MDFDDLDPSPAQFTGDSLLERVARAYEDATDAYGDACDGEAEAENAYRLLHAESWALAVEDKVAITKRGEWCDNQTDVCKARMEWNRAIARRQRCWAKARELENRMSAVQSHNRFIREGT